MGQQRALRALFPPFAPSVTGALCPRPVFPPFLHLEACPADPTTLPQSHEEIDGPGAPLSLNALGGGRGVSYSASGSVLDQNLPGSQTLRLDETMDSMGDDDPFTAKLSFEVRVPL